MNFCVIRSTRSIIALIVFTEHVFEEILLVLISISIPQSIVDVYLFFSHWLLDNLVTSIDHLFD